MAPKQENGKENKGHAAKMPDRRYGYFRDDQIMFVVTHNPGTIPTSLLEVFKEEINKYLGGVSGGTIEALPRSFSFPAIQDEHFQRRFAKLEELERLAASENNSSDYLQPLREDFSLLVCNLTGAPEEPIDLLNNIKGLRKDFVGRVIALGEGPFLKTHKVEGEITADAVAPGKAGDEIAAMTIQDVSPNWLMSAASQGAGTGGPGGLPAPFRGKDDKARYEFSDFKKRLENAGLYAEGDNVDVAILDAAPSPHELVLAQKEHPDNILLQSLLGPDGVLSLYPATYEETRRMTNTSLNRHDYKMTDHGLFAAGIVHSIVPKAKIHLIEVLNQFGVGDLQSLLDGLLKAYNQILNHGSTRKLVVNCSWMLDLPVSAKHCNAKDDPNPNEKDPEFDFEQSVLEFVLEAEKEQALTLWAICNSLFYAGGQVVAAAGNDWGKLKKGRDDTNDLLAGDADKRTQEPRPEARYPAGFVSAIGVGALPKRAKPDSRTQKYKASSYSNFGDKPAVKGILTLGGEEGKRKGVLGLYISKEYPVKKDPETMPETPHRRELKLEVRNEFEQNAWAWWAGTSFATPIVTGAIAAALASKALDTLEAVEQLYAAHIIDEAFTDVEEDIMLVTQDDELYEDD